MTHLLSLSCDSEQTHVRQAAQDYISNPQNTATGPSTDPRPDPPPDPQPDPRPDPLDRLRAPGSTQHRGGSVFGILDEVNRVKVPGASSSSKNVRYMENSKMLPPSKRFKMENSVTVHQNGLETPKTDSVNPLKSVPVSPQEPRPLEELRPQEETRPQEEPRPQESQEPSAMEVDVLLSNQEADPSDITAQMNQLEEVLKSPPTSTDAPPPAPSDPAPSGTPTTQAPPPAPCEAADPASSVTGPAPSSSTGPPPPPPQAPPPPPQQQQKERPRWQRLARCKGF
ncbi:hypothetical protein WMY93_013364 [Mugilogobius chulae]|uniref:Uncharacterized protein n=1 Tax=Mugilogobius chulae TaxID=88201 RepID=A0AAW0NZS8_9GOBI